ncbi:hypothetical protein NCAS_0A13510 [Naumovozyma castellii]|uniref:Uncharacterized protein n=1 Tax=Naumovozyma castellii TaxID=27288 RepID=G0V8W0_NAUCA|nr:hypothetical protein NCAS_0A13510 [Naumovozyma castellii CBS 4309]CCC67909.1 hypothetical protein NCAS_0A13510 [Naumovozyma castellii CBS 4309]
MNNPIALRVNAALFDVDGTIIISQPALAAFWKHFGEDKPYFDADLVTHATHGWRTYDAIEKFAPDWADREYVTQLEGEIPTKFGQHALEVPGAVKLCNEFNKLPKERWAVATSGTFEMASKWFELLKIERPTNFITANDVERGKPHPDPYLKGRNGLGFPINATNPSKSKVVVFEDAPAGIESGKAAGCKIVGVATTFDEEFLKEKGCDLIVSNHESIKLNGYYPETDEIELVFHDYLFAKDDLLEW